MGYVDADIAPNRNTGEIKLFGQEAFKAMHCVGRATAETLDLVAEHICPGISTREIDAIILNHALKLGATPATVYYRGYPRASCISLNHVVCHGIPGDRIIKEGDILNIDVTLIIDGWHGDSSRMYTVGAVSRLAERLVAITYECLMLGIEAVGPGATTGDIGSTIQAHAEANRMSVVRDFCGHGVAKLFHDVPNILHYGNPEEGIPLKPGMIFTIEPMINLGRPQVKILSDGWTAVTRDRSLSAQFEHTIGVTDKGCEIFTSSPANLDQPPYAP